MALPAEIETLQDDILADLTSVHDYYVNTKGAWRAVQRLIERGQSISIRNLSTGTVTTEKELPALAQFYVTEYLSSATFQQFVSLFEDFIFGLLRVWLLSFPHSLKDRKVAGSVVFAAPDLAAVKQAIVDSRLNELRYQKLREWIVFLDGLVTLGCPSSEEIERLTEMKASRDVLVHNRGMTNAVYEEKAGSQKRFVAGQRLDLPERYHRESFELIRKVISDVAAAAIAKASSGRAGTTSS